MALVSVTYTRWASLPAVKLQDITWKNDLSCTAARWTDPAGMWTLQKANGAWNPAWEGLVRTFLQDNRDPYQSFNRYNTETVIPLQALIFCRQPTFVCQTLQRRGRRVVLWMGRAAGTGQGSSSFPSRTPTERWDPWASPSLLKQRTNLFIFSLSSLPQIYYWKKNCTAHYKEQPHQLICFYYFPRCLSYLFSLPERTGKAKTLLITTFHTAEVECLQ